MISAKEAIDRLKEGNKRFVSGSPLLESLANPERCNEFASSQEPFLLYLVVPTRVCRRAVWSAFGCSSRASELWRSGGDSQRAKTPNRKPFAEPRHDCRPYPSGSGATHIDQRQRCYAALTGPPGQCSRIG